MVNLAHTAIALFILGVFAVSLMNPGGSMVAIVIALAIVVVMLLVPFVQQYVLSVNKGKNARKTPSASDVKGGQQK